MNAIQCNSIRFTFNPFQNTSIQSNPIPSKSNPIHYILSNPIQFYSIQRNARQSESSQVKSSQVNPTRFSTIRFSQFPMHSNTTLINSNSIQVKSNSIQEHWIRFTSIQITPIQSNLDQTAHSNIIQLIHSTLFNSSEFISIEVNVSELNSS